mmetsp:Transcript_471/g.801  ORF Transcript_471/g.801 Transcript_471/m.801 type:complete len:163 (-) Transcript_471:113-601(-)
MANLQIQDQEGFTKVLERLRKEGDDMDWVLVGYEGSSTVKVLAHGTGGLEAFRGNLQADKVQFGVLSFTMSGEGYSAAKNILITWLGPECPAGLAKARASAHRNDLRSFIQQTATVACELQAEQQDDLSAENVGQAISRTRNSSASSFSSADSQGSAASKYY